MKGYVVKLLLVILSLVAIGGCSVIGENNVESAPYTLLKADEKNNIEVRNYESMILVSTSMAGDAENKAFRKLFKYITGENTGQTQISMTAPVIMNKESTAGTSIAMTAPVFMDDNDNEAKMSFVMPADFTLQNTPRPTDPDVHVSEVSNYYVVAIQFNGTLSDSNVEKHERLLKQWMNDNDYAAKGRTVKAGYNGPLTLPIFRKNELLIPIEVTFN